MRETSFSREDLEDTGFFKVLSLLAGYATTPMGADMILESMPSTDENFIRDELGLSVEIMRLVESTDGFYLPPIRDTRKALRRAGGKAPLLDGRDLKDIALNVHAAIELRKSLKSLEEKSKGTAGVIARLHAPGSVAQAVDRAIGDEGEILDNASRELVAIRRRIADCRERIGRELKKFMGVAGTDVQEDIVTTRSSRYVVLLKTGAKSRNRGLVHDESGTGQAVYFEPLEVVEMNNDVARAKMEEQAEILRILRELTFLVAENLGALESDLATLADLDSLYARARFSSALDCNSPDIGAGKELRLLKARHPLLGKKAVPVDILFPKGVRFLIISGPNAGGKSVALKMTGLLPMMAQSGIPIPASADSTMPIFSTLLTDIGDKGSIESSLSTFSSHIVSLSRITREARCDSLVLIDEICDGTDPDEAAALAMGVVRHLKAAGATCLITSHYTPLKLFAMEEEGVENGAMTFDEVSLAPTYELKVGLPGKSFGLAIASRFGLDPAIVDSAKTFLSTDRVSIEDILGVLEAKEAEIAERLENARTSETRAASLSDEYGRLLSDLRIREEAAIFDLYESARRELDGEKRRIHAIVEKLRVRLGETDAPAFPDPGLPAMSGAESGAGGSLPAHPGGDEAVPADSGSLPVEPGVMSAVPLPGVDLGAKTTNPEDRGSVLDRDGFADHIGDPGQPGDARDALALIRRLRERVDRGLRNRPVSKAGFSDGDQVRIKTLGQKGTVIGGTPGDRAYTIEVGSVRVTVPAVNLEHLGSGEQIPDHSRVLERRSVNPDRILTKESFSPEIDIRGKYVDEALDLVERFLIAAEAHNMEWVRIIHGKGTGRLRKGVTDFLRESAMVESFRLADYHDGGSGATIVRVRR